MPRVTFEHSEFTPKPTGILRAKIIDCAWFPKDDRVGLPNLKSLQDPSAEGVIEWHLMPDGHDRIQKVYTVIKLAYKDGELNIKESYGIGTIHGILDQLGLQVAGFTASGTFVDEKDKPMQMDDMSTYVLQQIMMDPEFRVLIHIYKEKGSDGKHYFRPGMYFYMDTERGMQAAEASKVRDMEYMSKREAKQEQKQEQAPIQPTVAQPKSKRL